MSKPDIDSMISQFFRTHKPTVTAVVAKKGGKFNKARLAVLDELVSFYADACKLDYGLSLNHRDEVEAGIFDALEDKHGVGAEDFT